MGNALNVAVAWFLAEDYERIRQISGDTLPSTFAEWEARMMKALARAATAGVIAEKVILHPGELLAFARQMHATKIDDQVLNRFATLKLLGERPRSATGSTAVDGENAQRLDRALAK